MKRRAPLKPLSEATWFYWEHARLPWPLVRNKYPERSPWSAAARAVYQADPHKGPLCIEHSVPRRFVVRTLVDEPTPSLEALGRRLDSEFAVVVLTPDKDRMLGAAGLAARMPAGWKPADDPWARYQSAGIDVTGFAPLSTSPSA